MTQPIKHDRHTTTTHSKEITTMKNATETKTETSNVQTKETSMKKTKKTPATATLAATSAAASTTTATAAATSDIPAQIQAIEQACGYGDPLPDDSRKTSDNLIRRVPSTIVDRVLALAVRGGGVVAGIKLDPDAAKAALAQADQADEVATAALMLVRRAQDQSIRLRSGVTGTVSAIRTSLRGYAKTSQGASLAQESEELTSLAKQHKAAAKARKTRVVNAAAASTSPSNGSATAETPGTEPAAPPATPAAPPTPKAG